LILYSSISYANELATTGPMTMITGEAETTAGKIEEGSVRRGTIGVALPISMATYHAMSKARQMGNLLKTSAAPRMSVYTARAQDRP